MKLIVSGSSGLIGSAFVRHMSGQGHSVCRLIRGRPPTTSEVAWDPAAGTIDAQSLEDFDAVVHLAGENVAARRWTASQKARIKDSRVQSTRLLAETLTKLHRPPKVLIAASATGFYGDCGASPVDESSVAGSGFLADVCKAWESETEAVSQKVRVARLRTGVVLSAAGGALAKMLLPFKLGLGGRIGSGRQFMSWIDLTDLVGAIDFLIRNEGCAGPVNAVAPHPVTNSEFTKTLGRVLRRPTILPMPAIAARLVFGEMADELLLSSALVIPKRLAEAGFDFQYSDLESSLRHILG